MSAPPHAAPVSPIIEKRENGVALVTLNRPDKLNALNRDLAVALNQTLLSISTDKHVAVVVITGAGRAFCAGGDLAVIGKGHQDNDMTDLEPLLRSGVGSVMKIRTMRQPVIAAVNGPAAGAGMNIALAADVRIAADSASFAQSFVNVGLFPDYGGTYFLPELVGPAKAAELFYSGEMIDAKAALQLGIVNRVVPATELAETAMAFARRIADGPHLPIQAVKHVLHGAKRDALEAALEAEVEEQLKCFRSGDCGEGIRAFLEKRKPRFEKAWASKGEHGADAAPTKQTQPPAALPKTESPA
jgi:2-(1,2-epoxy-1,2-dihydrophenyl)acetyl-CoA isomerase